MNHWQKDELWKLCEKGAKSFHAWVYGVYMLSLDWILIDLTFLATGSSEYFA